MPHTTALARVGNQTQNLQQAAAVSSIQTEVISGRGAQDSTAKMADWAGIGALEEVRILVDRHF